MEPINKDNEKIEEIKNIEKNEMRELSHEELEGVAGGIIDWATPILGRLGRRTGGIIGQTPDTPKENL